MIDGGLVITDCWLCQTLVDTSLWDHRTVKPLMTETLPLNINHGNRTDVPAFPIQDASYFSSPSYGTA